MNPEQPRYGAIEAGGTKWVCAVADAGGQIIATDVIPTTTPAQTIGGAVAFLRRHGPLAAVGVGTFGPVDLRAGSPSYGHITTTPKPGWAHTDVVSPLREALRVPVGLDTDVNAAALGEWRRGAGRGLDTFAYLTVGTGIGMGAVVNGRLLHGLLHPEFGHIRVPHDQVRDPYPGGCPFHGDCLEGLASGAAMRQRWGRPAEQLDDPRAWELEADYLAHAVMNLTYTLSPERIVIGGGVAGHPGLMALVRARVLDLAAGYPAAEALTVPAAVAEYVTGPALGGHSGITGAAELARAASS
ncbi:fructokinase [Sphaerisporangium melleum]|uniref:fructokinase n=1 Tax=Sphaerisporangium melleum TaxID=321316 RepID=A0A917VI50_9ACTN|nr:ROK family protein [Sphaerisporangium melleum]GGK81262.1 fructokinase [Sphaerisporangium melleum]GII73867.1 fructokinase [Sphaerisporangium melleum]